MSAPWRQKSPGGYWSARVPPTDAGVTCAICGDVLRVLGNHLRSHGLTSTEYLERFPGAPLASDEFRAIQQDLYLDRFGTLKRWTRAAIIGAFKDYARKSGGKPPTRRQWASARKPWDYTGTRPSYGSVVAEFGSWNAAVEAAGLVPRVANGAQVTCIRGHELTEVQRGERVRRHCATCASERRKAA